MVRISVESVKDSLQLNVCGYVYNECVCVHIWTHTGIYWAKMYFHWGLRQACWRTLVWKSLYRIVLARLGVSREFKFLDAKLS